MDRPVDTLVFSHGNGFPGGTYRALFGPWREAGWQVDAVDRYGHDPRFPVSSNWPRLRDQLIDHIETLQAARPGAERRPVVLVGHSLGGFLSLKVAAQRPDLVRALVLLDSPLLTGWRAHSVQVAKATRLISRVSPGKVSSRRRQHWPSAQACFEHFAAKHTFARWAPGVLQDYIDAGTEPAPAGDPHGPGVVLRFDRRIETRIYDTLPHQFAALLRRHPVRCPAAFIAGTQSVEVRQVGLSATRALVHERLRWIEGSHLYPMERPLETAQTVLELLREMGVEAAR